MTGVRRARSDRAIRAGMHFDQPWDRPLVRSLPSVLGVFLLLGSGPLACSSGAPESSGPVPPIVSEPTAPEASAPEPDPPAPEAPAPEPPAPEAGYLVVEATGGGYIEDSVAVATFEAHRAQVDACVAEATASGTELAGTVSFNAFFHSDGRLFRTSVPQAYNQLGAPALEGCIDSAMQTWDYPAPPPGDTRLARFGFRLHFGEGEPLPPELVAPQ